MPTTKTRAATATPMPASRGRVGAAACGTPDSSVLYGGIFSAGPRLAPAIDDAYGDAILAAARETSLPEETFPSVCIYTVGQIFDDRWLPNGD